MIVGTAAFKTGTRESLKRDYVSMKNNIKNFLTYLRSFFTLLTQIVEYHSYFPFRPIHSLQIRRNHAKENSSDYLLPRPLMIHKFRPLQRFSFLMVLAAAVHFSLFGPGIADQPVVVYSADRKTTASIQSPERPLFGKERRQMVDEQLIARGIKDPEVLAVMRKVPRHLYVPEKLADSAYQDRPLPIGSDQTISQPYIVACMTEQLKLSKDDRVLEVGTGSGYQAAVLAELCKEVVSIEIIESLARAASEVLAAEGYSNVTVLWGDGYQGYSKKAPYDAIIVTAAPEKIPEPLLEQLAPGGRLIIPVGNIRETQQLKLVKKDKEGKLEEFDILDVRFVPLTRKVR